MSASPKRRAKPSSPNAAPGRTRRVVAGRVAQTRAEFEQLMHRMREANERLIVAAVRAQDLSDEAHAQTTRAKTDLEELMKQLRDAHDRLTETAAHAQTMADDARQREEAYRHLSNRLLTLQDEERRRLARDLHDSTGQRLAALTMNLDLVEGVRDALDTRSQRALAESRSLARQCSQEVRTLAYLLHPPLLDETGLVSAVRWYVEGFTARSDLQIVLDLGDVGRLPEAVETALFRIVQEGLTNIHRHASADTATIRLTRTSDAVHLDIEDRGRGLHDRRGEEPHAARSGTLGVGIQGMRERVRQLGGTFDIAFTKRGTTVRVGVPLDIS